MKTFKKILFLIILTISAFTLQTCKPDDDINKTYGPYTLGEGNDYINFKPGSWWVYQNSKNGLFDTMILKSISITTQTFKGKNTVIKDVVNMLIYSTTTGFEYKYYTFGANPDLKPEYLVKANSIDLILGKSKPGEYHGETVPFFFPFDTNRHSGMGLGVATYIGIDTNIIIKGKVYKQVRKFQQEYDALFANNTGQYFWAKDVGLIKLGIPKSNDFWEIVDYYVEKP